MPGCVPAGTSISSSPSRVGTVTVVPRAAAVAGTSTAVISSLLADEALVVGHPHQHVQVTWRPATLAGVAAAGEPDPLLVGDTRRDVHFERLANGAATAPGAFPAGLAGDPAVAAAGRAGRSANELPECSSGDRPELSRPAALLAHVHLGSRLRPVAAAALARLDHVELDLRRRALGRAGQVHLDLHGHVAALHPAATAAAEGRERVAAEESVEDVGEGAEAVCRGRVPARVEPSNP